MKVFILDILLSNRQNGRFNKIFLTGIRSEEAGILIKVPEIVVQFLRTTVLKNKGQFIVNAKTITYVFEEHLWLKFGRQMFNFFVVQYQHIDLQIGNEMEEHHQQENIVLMHNQILVTNFKSDVWQAVRRINISIKMIGKKLLWKREKETKY